MEIPRRFLLLIPVTPVLPVLRYEPVGRATSSGTALDVGEEKGNGARRQPGHAQALGRADAGVVGRF